MDDIVKQAMQKWPNVPACCGWLGLDERGQWWMRDERAQTIGAFQSGVKGAKGSRLTHDKLIAFIERNYQSDPDGCWYFQNGPQKVYVELLHAPWVLRVDGDGQTHTHTAQVCHVKQALQDEHGHVYLSTNLGLGLVHPQDVIWAAHHIEQGDWGLEDVFSADLPLQHRFVRSPEQNNINGKNSA
jgi:Protein of unknown function (DUF2946)